jgi:peptidoglycan/LPS O-acetylase OafA/YrhL
MLAMMVVVSHTHVLAGRGDVLAPFGLGNLGVMAFFVLSGYVISEAVAVFYANRPGAFLINRILRIHPPFFVALFFSVLLHWLASLAGPLRFFDAQPHPERMLELNNVLSNALSMVLPVGLGRLGFSIDYIFVRYSWAIAAELAFYYLVALLLWLAARRWMARRLGASAFWGAVAFLILTTYLALGLPNYNLFFVGWAPYFILGMALYQLSAGPSGISRVGLVALACGALALLNWHAYTYMARNPNALAGLSVVLLDALIAAVWLLGNARMPARLIPVDRFAGDLTYPLYLNHYAVSVVALSVIPDERLGLPVFFAYVLVAIGFAYVAMQCSEPLTKHLRERIRGQKL